MISDFTSLKVSQELPKKEQNYKVEFVSAWNDQRKGTPATVNNPQYHRRPDGMV